MELDKGEKIKKKYKWMDGWKLVSNKSGRRKSQAEEEIILGGSFMCDANSIR